MPPYSMQRLLLSVSGFALILVPPASAVDRTAVERLAGADRVGTAVAASLQRTAAADVLLTTGGAFPDALAAAALAARLDAPVLLTGNQTLPEEVSDEIARLGAERVWILGGSHAIAPAIEDQLRASGLEVRRLAGGDRYQTAAAVALGAGRPASGEVALALGEHPEPSRAWPDAIAAGTLAALPEPVPTLLTRPDALPAATVAALRHLRATRVLVVGGTVGIPESIVTALQDLRLEVERVAGASRYATSVELAERVQSARRDPAGTLLFASGERFPDALGAAALAAHVGAPLVLVPSSGLAPEVDAFVRAGAPWQRGLLVGGDAAAGDALVGELEAALAGAPPPVQQAAETVVSTFEGVVSWYGPGFEGRQTGCGEPYDSTALTAAHLTLPCGTSVRLTNQVNGAQVVVRVNDRGPHVVGRVMDLSAAAADVLGFRQQGITAVRGEVLADR